MFGDAHSRRHDRSMLNQTGINISVDPNVTDPFSHTCMPFNSVQGISMHQNCVVCLAEGRKKSMYVYCGLCAIMSHREIDRHPSLHAYCMGGKYQFFQRHVENCFCNQMEDGNTLTQRFVEKQPRVTTVDGPQKKFRKIKRKRRGETAAQSQIKILSPPVDEVVTENEKSKKKLRGL